MTNIISVEHLARIEGHGGITVELENGRIGSVRFDVFEGARLLETIVRGRSYEDISQIVSRICAICSVAHSLTSIKATEQALGVEPTAQTLLLRDLLFRGESIESHALHLFFLAVPDYLGYPSAIAMAAEHGGAVKLALRMKKLGNTIQDTIGGRAVHPVNALLGGFGKLPDEAALVVLRDGLQQALADCDAALNLLASLPPVPFCHSETVYAALRSPGAYGYYEGNEVHVLANGSRQTVAARDYRSLTNEKAVPHSHAKHSTFNGRPFMVGALARLSANLDKLDGRALAAIEQLGLKLPSNEPMDNNKAQAVELVFDIEQSLKVVERLLRDGVKDERPVAVRPRAGTGTAITEAPRGILIHSYTYDKQGRMAAADVITPTALNAASIEDHLRRTAEQNNDKDPAQLRRKLEMIVRAYDPCVSCSVH